MPQQTSEAVTAALRVARAVRAALPDPLGSLDTVLGDHARKIGLPLPPLGLPKNWAAQLPVAQASIILTYAVCSLVRGRSPEVRATAAEIGEFLGLGRHDIELAIPRVMETAATAPPADSVAALATFFEADPWTKSLAAEIAQRLEVRRGKALVAHIKPQDYEHPADRAALSGVRAAKGIEAAIRYVSEHSVEKMLTIESLANRIRVTRDQFPLLYALFCEAVEILGMPRVPDLYLEPSPPNAFTTGVDKPQVVLSYALPGLLTRDELLFVMGHELGHIRSGHGPLQLASSVLPQLTDILGQLTLGIGGVVGMGVEALLFDWYRKSELTCDRCGLLACQSPDGALSALMKLAGAPPVLYRQMNLQAFLAQAESYDALDTSLLSKTFKVLRTTFGQLDHPWLALRARELSRWVKNGDYQGLLSKQVAALGSACPACGAALQLDDAFCIRCGARVAR